MNTTIRMATIVREGRTTASQFTRSSRLTLIPRGPMHCSMRQRISKDLVAASATPLLLAILHKGPSYGYAIIQEVRELSGGELEWSEGMLYPVLHRLEEHGLIESYEERGDTGRKRRYY